MTIEVIDTYSAVRRILTAPPRCPRWRCCAPPGTASPRPSATTTGAGYAVGNRVVDAYLAATGRTAAEAVTVDAADVIRFA